MSESLWAVVPAAGEGVRAGTSVPKQFCLLEGKTVLEWTVERLLALPVVRGVVVVLPRGRSGFADGSPDYASGSESFERTGVVAWARSRLESLGVPGRPVIAVPGGATRQESVRLGLQALPADTVWVAVHDASRPCFSQELFHRVLDAACASGAAIPALRPTDTVKSVTSVPSTDRQVLLVHSTLDRTALVEAQTPQVFDAGLLRRAHDMALKSGVVGTDDSGLVESLGHSVSVVPGERQNLKITYREDFEIAGRLLADGPGASPHRGWATVTGLGFDLHPLVVGRQCVLGGVAISCDSGPFGHSDGDVVCHSIMDAILGALGKGDIGLRFPDSDPRYLGASSVGLLREMWLELSSMARIVHIDVTVIAEMPRISPHVPAMKAAIAGALEVFPDQISVKATTTERLGALGRGEGIACLAVATLLRPDVRMQDREQKQVGE